IGSAEAAERNARPIALAHGVGIAADERSPRRAGARGPLAVDGPRSDRVDAHVGSELERQPLCQLDHGRLGRAVVRELGTRSVSGTRAQVHDGTRAAGRGPIAPVGLRAQEGSLDADVDGAVVELLAGHARSGKLAGAAMFIPSSMFRPDYRFRGRDG